MLSSRCQGSGNGSAPRQRLCFHSRFLRAPCRRCCCCCCCCASRDGPRPRPRCARSAPAALARSCAAMTTRSTSPHGRAVVGTCSRSAAKIATRPAAAAAHGADAASTRSTPACDAPAHLPISMTLIPPSSLLPHPVAWETKSSSSLPSLLLPLSFPPSLSTTTACSRTFARKPRSASRSPVYAAGAESALAHCP